LPSVGELQSAWIDAVLPALSGRARARFNAGSFTAVAEDAEFALPNPIHRDRCEELRPEVEAALATHFGRPVPMRLIVSGDAGAGSAPVSVPAVDDTPAPAAERPKPPPRAQRAAAPAPEREPDPEPFDDYDPHDDVADIADLEDADVATNSVDRLTELFPGAQVVEE
jgi:DNA polymerase III subunit gamma/tau